MSLHHRRGRTTASARSDSLRAPPWIWRTWPPGPISGPSGRGWAGVGVSSRIGVAIAGRHAGWVATCPRRTRRWRGRLVLRARQRFAACRGGATLRVSVVSRLLCPGPSDGIVSCVCAGARGPVSCQVPRGWCKGRVRRSAGGLPPAEGVGAARRGRACGRGSRVPVLTGSPGHRVVRRREASVVSGAAGAGARATFAASAG